MSNPYAPPADDEDADPPSDDRRPFIPASLGRRWLGAFIDNLFRGALFYAVTVLVALATSQKGVPGLDALDDFRRPWSGLAWLVAWLVGVAINAALVATRGQSVGKMVMRTRIVDENGERVSAVNGVLVRMLPFEAMVLVPVLGAAAGMSSRGVEGIALLASLVELVDGALILGPYRQCLHDRVAGTYVAIVGSERPPRASRPRRKRKRKPAANV